MKRILAVLVVATATAICGQAEPPPVGFFEDSASSAKEFEEVFMATPAPARARAWLAALTEEPHVAGTPQETKVAEYVHDRLREFGLDAEIVTYEVYLNHPERVAARIIAPV